MNVDPRPADSKGVMVGPPVTGDDFYDRELEMRDFMELLAGGAHVSVTAPRRIGKTSLLLEAKERHGSEYAFLYVDLEACTTEPDVIVKLALQAKDHRDLAQKVKDGFRNVLSSFSSAIEEIGVSELTVKLREGLSGDWRAKADEVVDRLAEAPKPVVVCFDELPVLVSALLCGDDGRMTAERIARGRVFLSWLREATIRAQGRIRFVVSGSIGLEPLLTRAGISETMTTFTPLLIGPWERPIALEFVTDRVRRAGVCLAEGSGDGLLDKLGYLIPHHVALFVHYICLDARRREASVCTPDDIERVYDQHMLSPHGHVDLATYEDRLRRAVAPETLRAALELLTETAVAGRLRADTALAIMQSQGFAGQDALDNLRFLLAVFEHDGYLKRTDEEYVFASHLLRDWWKHRFGFGYVPADRR